MSARDVSAREVSLRAWELHRENGHPPDFDGPCWGPTPDELAQALAEVNDARPRPAG